MKATLLCLYHTFMVVWVVYIVKDRRWDGEMLSEWKWWCMSQSQSLSLRHSTWYRSVNDHPRASPATPSSMSLWSSKDQGTSLGPECWAKATILLPAGLAQTGAAAVGAGRGTRTESLCFCLHSLESSGCSITKCFSPAIDPPPQQCCCWASQTLVPFWHGIVLPVISSSLQKISFFPMIQKWTKCSPS